MQSDSFVGSSELNYESFNDNQSIAQQVPQKATETIPGTVLSVSLLH